MFEQCIRSEAEFRATKRWLGTLRVINEQMRRDPALPLEFRIMLYQQIDSMRKAVRIWGYNNQRKPVKYKQTKESFEKFLAECRELAKEIALPLPASIDCPWCRGSSYLLTEQFGHVVDGHAWKGVHHFYHCDNCKESYTTNESDGISLASLKEIKGDVPPQF